jgi:hypothetical protein
VNDKIRRLLGQITALDDELRATLHEQEGELRYKIEGGRVAFEQSIREAHAKLRQGALSWFFDIPPLNLLTAPVIYSMVVPLAVADLCVSLYQAICFPIYGIAKVRRRDCFVFDRHQLAYLNAFEKFHCQYCSYANGVLAYAREIVARTEQYFCISARSNTRTKSCTATSAMPTFWSMARRMVTRPRWRNSVWRWQRKSRAKRLKV